MRGVERQIELQHIDSGFAQKPELAPFGVFRHQFAHDIGLRLRTRATRASWYSAAAGLMCGSRPLADAVTRSTGTGC